MRRKEEVIGWRGQEAAAKILKHGLEVKRPLAG